jgi:mono/diheme cytochrome c family protein
MKKQTRWMLLLGLSMIAALILAACGAAATPTAAPTKAPTAPVAPTAEPAADVARPSNPGGPGPALQLTGDPAAGKQIFVDNCQKCHGENGVGGVENPGSDDGTIPELNPIDDTMVSSDLKVFAYNFDLFVEHGSDAAGTNVKEKMPAWGDEKKLTPQQIADVIAYVISLNTK